MTRLVEDQLLREAFRRGELPALEEVYRLYAPAVFSYLARGFSFSSAGTQRNLRGLTPCEQENLAQDVFLRAFSEPARRGYDGVRPYRNYLLTIARNVVLDRLRLKHRDLLPLEELSDEEFARLDDRWIPNPEEEALAQEVDRLVEAFLTNLDPVERSLFENRFQQGLTIQECARALGISEHAVKSREQRLRRRLFHHMHRAGYFNGFTFSRGTIERLGVLVGLWLGMFPAGSHLPLGLSPAATLSPTRVGCGMNPEELLWNDPPGGGRCTG